jgi:glutamate/aspartate transport system substrate-binding protein
MTTSKVKHAVPLAGRALKVLGAVSSLLCAGMALAQAPAGAETAKPEPDPRTTLQRIRETNIVRVGHRLDALPFAYLGDKKQPIGYGIDVCNDLVAGFRKELKLPNLRVEYVPVTASNRMELVKQGKVDMECGFTVSSPERRNEVGFSLPYFFSGLRIMVKDTSPIRDFHDLPGHRVATTKGSNAVPALKQRIDSGLLKGTTLVEFANNNDAMAALKKGDVDAFVTGDIVLFAYRAVTDNPKSLLVVGNYLLIEHVAIMLKKDDADFKRLVDKGLAGLMLDGVVPRYYAKWFKNPVPPNNVVVDIPLNQLLRDQFLWPTDRAEIVAAVR